MRLAAIVDYSEDAIISKDLRGIILTWNKAAELLFGYGASEIVGTSITRLIPPERLSDEKMILGKLRRGERIEHYETVRLGKDGRPELERRIVEASAVEQRRIGQDLHDGLCQDLVGIALQADAIARSVQASSPSKAAEINQISAAVRRAAGDCRQFSHGLNPVDLQAGGLPMALAGLAAKISDSFEVRCMFKWDQSAQTHDAATATHLYRISQEAITNAIRHGKATRIEVDLRMSKGTLALTVKDIGTGLSPLATNDNGQPTGQAAGPCSVHTGIGIQGMYYRGHLVGGVFDLRPHRRGGTVATCSIAKQLGLPATKAASSARRQPSKALSDKARSPRRRASR